MKRTHMRIEITPQFLKSQGLSPSFPERFWQKVDVRGPNECWIWIAALRTGGYGCIQKGAKGEGVITASRASWILHHGEIPDGLHCLHNCPGGDNPACVNPAHLWLGTHTENDIDRDNKQRQARGEQHGRAKFTVSKVLQIRWLYSKGFFQKTIAKQFRTSQQQISDLILRKTWRHI